MKRLIKATQSRFITGLLIVIGWLSVVLGIIGIFLPLLPTTPFLLLAAACFVRSSPRFYQWLIRHPKLGGYVIHYLNGEGMPKKAKLFTILLIWSTMGLSAWLVAPVLWIKLALFITGLLVSAYILRLPTMQPHKINS